MDHFCTAQLLTEFTSFPFMFILNHDLPLLVIRSMLTMKECGVRMLFGIIHLVIYNICIHLEVTSDTVFLLTSFLLLCNILYNLGNLYNAKQILRSYPFSFMSMICRFNTPHALVTVAVGINTV